MFRRAVRVLPENLVTKTKKIEAKIETKTKFW